MASVVSRLTEKGLIRPPVWLPDNVRFECIQGSIAYGVSTDTSDYDTVGWCVPPKDIVFPHCGGQITGFGTQKQKFNCYQKHHIKDQEACGGKGREYDVSIYNIVHYFHYCMANNPNMLASLYVPSECITHTSIIGNMVREKRHIFLHKGCWQRFKGYAYSQLAKLTTKVSEVGSKRAKLVDAFGYDTKFAYHLVRLMYEVEQILTVGDLDLRRNSDELKSIRRGDWPLEKVHSFFSEKEKSLERIYEECDCIPWGPREDEIKQLLLDCLEEHWGSLDGCIVTDRTSVLALREISAIIDRNKHLIL